MIAKTTCNNQINYSTVQGNRILPFLFALNLDKSILYPNEGQYQKFCYEITGIGQDTSEYADLSHFLFGVCDTITQKEIAEISVIINNEPQIVIWGENVSIKTKENPDNPTGCAGLKFDFPLNKLTGTMEVCISLYTTYDIKPMNVCLYGGGTTASGLSICGPGCNNSAPCESVFYQKETVCVPVKVTPYAKPGTAKATCCGEPIVKSGTQCSGNQTSCSLTITQNLCIEIPISFGADIETGTAVVQCGTVSETPCDCSEPPAEVPPVQNTTIPESRDRRFFNR